MKRAIISLLLCCTACVPQLYKPAPKVPVRYRHDAEMSLKPLPHDIRWWKVFGDPVLDSLEEQALANNRDLASAASRVEAARLNLSAAAAPFLPQIGTGVTAGADYLSSTKIIQKYSVEPTLSWEISLFGELRNTKKAAAASVLATEWAFRGVTLSLTAEVATAYFTLLQYERDLEIARRSYALRRESAALIDSMFRYGMSNSVALEQARSLVYTAEADIPQYTRAVEQTWQTLGILMGEPPLDDAPTGDGSCLSTDRYPLEVPAGIPSDLLHRRPDVMQAYFTMEEAAARVGIARARRFPNISLTAAGGVASSSVKGLVHGNPGAWSTAVTLAEPVFAFGKLKRSEQIAREDYHQSVFAYELAILQALADVEDALVSITTYRMQADRTARLVEANEAIARMNRALYDSGMSAYLDVIDAERSLYESQMEYVDLITQQYISYVDLYKALGGGW